MTSRPPPQCLSCMHWRSPLDRDDEDAQQEQPTQVCAAYPLAHGGIPGDIWWNRVDHRTAHAGDQGIVWEPDGDMEFPDWAMSTATTT